ncbi:arginine-tRNA-protein transferase [Phellopilus nigrolimitatus]|nr:arginine-tRNA-protein transferase [Phellopilus nigrolimitatus]
MASVLSPVGYHDSTCGYCSPSGARSAAASSHSVGLTARRLTCADYQAMLDRGWRRSGDYCYKPDMRRTCCPQYTIRLDVCAFAPSKKQRKVVHRWNRYVLEGDAEMSDGPPRGKAPKQPPPFALVGATHTSEAAFCAADAPPKHRFEVTLEPASYTDEKFRLYCHYQQHVHNEPAERSPGGFKRFLVESPLEPAPIPYAAGAPPSHLPRTYGSYHQLYRVDGALAALAVLDVLPGCVSSVYFVYGAAWARFSLGKLSALREAALAREMHEHGCADLRFLYMGFYIHSCQKMRYKGEYHPSFLLDPEEYTWHALGACTPLLDAHRYACFAHPAHSLKDPDVPPEPTPEDLAQEDAAGIMVYHRSAGVVPLTRTRYMQSEYIRELILHAIEGLGVDLAKRVVFAF